MCLYLQQGILTNSGSTSVAVADKHLYIRVRRGVAKHHSKYTA